jgi:hypothetical protein
VATVTSRTQSSAVPPPKYLPPKWTGVVGLTAGYYALRSQRPPSGTGCGIRLVDFVEESKFLYKIFFLCFLHKA